MVFVRPDAVLESRIAWRSEPGPLSAVVVTRKTPSVIANLRLESARAVRLGIEGERGETMRARRRRVGQALQGRVQGRERAAVGQRSGPVARAGQAGGARERQRPDRDRERQVPHRVERPGIRILQGDGIARARTRR